MTAQLHRPVTVSRLNGPTTLEIVATDEERARIAGDLELLEIERLAAEVALRPWRGEGVRVTGSVSGKVRQSCGVTLEPVVSQINETFDVRLHPDASLGDGEGPMVIDPEAPDPPELLSSDTLDVGQLVLEYFVLGVPAYPRASDATFDGPKDAEDDEPSPFAALQALRDRMR